MNENNFTASFLGFMNRKICDELGNPIYTMKVSNEQLPYRFLKPGVKINILQTEDINKNPSVKTIQPKSLERYGFCLITLPLDKKARWDKNVRNRVKIASLNDPMIHSYKKLNRGQDTVIEFDEANLKVRLRGKKVSPSGVTEWFAL